MFTWNLPALIRNGVWFTLLCIAMNWNLLAWFFILFIVFVEMDEELTKYETYSDYYTAQLELYDFSKYTAAGGWNLEEQLRIFNEMNPQVVQQHQKTFHNRIRELRQNPNKNKPKNKKQERKIKMANQKEQIKLKQQVFGYTENYWDEQETLYTNEYVELVNTLSASSMLDWYHISGLVVPEQEYNIKNISLYHNKYSDLEENIQHQFIINQATQELYDKINLPRQRNSNPNYKISSKLYHRVNQINPTSPDEKPNNLLYWSMSNYQKAKYNYPPISTKNNNKYMDKRVNYLSHIKSLSEKPQQNWMVNQMPKLNTAVVKELQPSLGQVRAKYYNYRHRRKKTPSII